MHMTLNRFKGYIWQVTTEQGLEVFKTEFDYFMYGYSRNRFPKEGDVLFFYHDRQIIGFVPVAQSAGKVGETYEHKENWRYAVGLAFDEKQEFKKRCQRHRRSRQELGHLRGRFRSEAQAHCSGAELLPLLGRLV